MWATGLLYIHRILLASVNLSNEFITRIIRGPRGIAAANSYNAKYVNHRHIVLIFHQSADGCLTPKADEAI